MKVKRYRRYFHRNFNKDADEIMSVMGWENSVDHVLDGVREVRELRVYDRYALARTYIVRRAIKNKDLILLRLL